MDINRFTSLGRYSQSMETKEICIFVVNDDHVCHKIASSMLKDIIYEAFNYEKVMDAIDAIRDKKETIKIVITNVHRIGKSQLGIIQHIIDKEFNLPTLLMSPDENKNAISRGLASAATLYYVKFMSIDDVKTLYMDALMRYKGKEMAAETDAEKGVIFENADEASKGNTSSSEEGNLCIHKRKRKENKEISEQNENAEKKPRVVWTPEMHQKFLYAMQQLGDDKAFPKKIVELMNVPGLTRENVASHLQKYRMCLKRAREGLSDYYRTSSTNIVNAPSIFDAAFEFSQQPSWRHTQLGSRTNIVMPSSSSNSSIFEPRTSFQNSKFQLVQQPYRSFDPSRINFRNAHEINHQFPQVNQNFRSRTYVDQTKNILFSIENKRPICSIANCVTSSTSSGTSFMGLRLASDGKSVHFGNMGSVEIKRDSRKLGNENPSNLENSIPCQENSLSSLKSHTIEDFVLPCQKISIPSNFHQEMFFRRNGYENVDSIRSSFNDGLLGRKNYLASLSWDKQRDINLDPTPSVRVVSHLEQQYSLPPLPSEMPNNVRLDSNTSSFIYNHLEQQYSLLPLPSEMHDNVVLESFPPSLIYSHLEQPNFLPLLPSNMSENLDSSSIFSPLIYNPLEPQNSLPPLPSEMPMNVNVNAITSTFIGNLLEHQNLLPPSERFGDASVVQQYPLPVNCITESEASEAPLMTLPFEENSFGMNGGMESLLEGAGNTSTEFLLGGDFGDEHFNLHCD